MKIRISMSSSASTCNWIIVEVKRQAIKVKNSSSCKLLTFSDHSMFVNFHASYEFNSLLEDIANMYLTKCVWLTKWTQILNFFCFSLLLSSALLIHTNMYVKIRRAWESDMMKVELDDEWNLSRERVNKVREEENEGNFQKILQTFDKGSSGGAGSRPGASWRQHEKQPKQWKSRKTYQKVNSWLPSRKFYSYTSSNSVELIKSKLSGSHEKLNRCRYFGPREREHKTRTNAI